jgi:hypothetical protein
MVIPLPDQGQQQPEFQQATGAERKRQQRCYQCSTAIDTQQA